jgi:prepilin-type N-terminal cleavage/methylation domain-containing protein
MRTPNYGSLSTKMSRRGWTLIELLVVIAVSTVLMGIAVTTLCTLMQAEHNGRGHISRTATIARLAEQFRRDVRAALPPAAGKGEPKDQWQFALPDDRTVTYQALAGEVERSESLGGKPVRRESYILSADCSAEIGLPTDAAPATASLVITSRGSASATSHEIRIEASLGMDHRFHKALGGSP